MLIHNFKAVEAPIMLPNYQNLLEWAMPFLTRGVNKIMTRLLKMTEKKNYKRRGAICLQEGAKQTKETY